MSRGPVLVSPSILAADFTRLGEEVAAVEAAGADYVHYDVMDGHFVPNLSFGPKLVGDCMRGAGSIRADVHLMIERPEDWLGEYLKLKPHFVSFHVEATRDPRALAGRIRAVGARACVALKPATGIGVLEPLLGAIDAVLIMLVEPGFAGQRLLPETVSKVAQARKLAELAGMPLEVQVDGGIKADNFEEIVDLGADNLVLGSGIFAQPDYAEVIARIKAYVAG